jgi:hypothetical protein
MARQKPSTDTSQIWADPAAPEAAAASEAASETAAADAPATADEPAGEVAAADQPASEEGVDDEDLEEAARPERRALPFGAVWAGIAWLALASVLALGGAGLVGELTHPPGGPSREELTFAGDHALASRLDDASARLREVAGNVDRLSSDAKAALAALATTDSATLQKNLDHGSGIAVVITTETKDLRNSLAGLPGDGPAASLQFSNATLVRRAAILAALDSANGLADRWETVTGRSVDAARLASMLNDHETTVAAAASLGVQGRYADALAKLAQAATTLQDITGLQAQLITSSSSDVTVLDAWVSAHTRYDNALVALYKALTASHGKNSLEVMAALREEGLARAQLPSDDRQLVLIIAQIAASGLDQAVVAIEDASGRINSALAEASPS